MKEPDEVVEAGSDVATDGVVRWRSVDLQRVVAETHKVALGERSIGRILSDRGFRPVSVRPLHSKSDPEARAL